MTAYLINHLRQPGVLHRAQSGSVDRRFGSTQRERGSRPLELQYLLPDDQGSRERSRRIVAFIQIGLAEFGLQHRDAMSTVIECARAAHGDPAAAARLATARFLGGQYTLYVGFADRLGGPRAGCTPVMRMQPARADAASAPLDFEDRAEFNATKALRPI